MKTNVKVFLMAISIISFYCTITSAGTTENNYVKVQHSSGTWQTLDIMYWMIATDSESSPCTADETRYYVLAPYPLAGVYGIKASIRRTDSNSLYYYADSWYWDKDSGNYWNPNVDLQTTAPVGDERIYNFTEEDDLSDWDYAIEENLYLDQMWSVCYEYTSTGNRYERRYIFWPHDY